MLSRTSILTSAALFTVLPCVLATAKRGIAWPYFEQQGVSDVFSPSAISWVYDYETYTPRPQGSNYGGLQWFCMQGKRDAPSSPIASLASNCAQAGEYVMGFNEPDNYNADGSGIDPATAVQLWRQYFEPLRAQGKKLVAPGVTSSTENGKGLSWLDAFVGLCQGCHFDAFAFHPYAQDAAAVQGSIDYVASKYSPLWVSLLSFSPFLSSLFPLTHSPRRSPSSAVTTRRRTRPAAPTSSAA